MTVIGRKKVKMPQVEFDLKAVRKIKERKKNVCKTKSGKRRWRNGIR